MKITHRDTGAVIFEDTAETVAATLKAAILYGANLSRANLYGANLYGADLSRADLSGAYLSRADLSRADLSGADLSGANLYGANLYGANLSRADLSGADLSGAYLSRAYLKGTKEAPEAVLMSLEGRTTRQDNYEFLIFKSEDLGNIIRAGCRTFTLEEFRQHVAKKYPGTPKAEETLRILDFLEAQLNGQSWY